MGCGSSTELGGAYPGNRRTPNAPYQPPPSAFSGGQATAHFVRYGGGNALVLQQGGIAQPQVGASPVMKQPEYIQVTLPDGVYGGQTIQVQAPDGRLNEIIVPDGFGPGSTFTVEFADAPAPVGGSGPTTGPGGYGGASSPLPSRVGANMEPYVSTTSTATTTITNNNFQGPSVPATEAAPVTSTGPTFDDGFASGFNNPSFVPINSNNNDVYGQYPSAGDARPVYSAAPSYPSQTY